MRRREFLVAIPIGAASLAFGRGEALADVLLESLGDPLDTLPQAADLGAATAEPTMAGDATRPRSLQATEITEGTDVPRAAEPPPRAAPWPLLAPLRAGSEIGLGWRLVSLSPIRHGASVITLSRGGRSARVHLCARRGRGRGIASTRHFDLLLMNDGDGSRSTDESLGRVVKTLGAYVARAERARARRVVASRGMLGHDARVERYADAPGLLA